MTRLGIALATCTVGLIIIFYSLERLSLTQLAHSLGQGDGQEPMSVRVWLFIGLAAMNLSVFYALTVWADYLRDNHDATQVPVPVLAGVIVLGGGAGVAGLAIHAGWIRSLAEVPTSVSWGYILFQSVTGAVALAALVLVAVRWAPGYKRRLKQA